MIFFAYYLCSCFFLHFAICLLYSFSTTRPGLYLRASDGWRSYILRTRNIFLSIIPSQLSSTGTHSICCGKRFISHRHKRKKPGMLQVSRIYIFSCCVIAEKWVTFFNPLHGTMADLKIRYLGWQGLNLF